MSAFGILQPLAIAARYGCIPPSCGRWQTPDLLESSRSLQSFVTKENSGAASSLSANAQCKMQIP